VKTQVAGPLRSSSPPGWLQASNRLASIVTVSVSVAPASVPLVIGPVRIETKLPLTNSM